MGFNSGFKGLMIWCLFKQAYIGWMVHMILSAGAVM